MRNSRKKRQIVSNKRDADRISNLPNSVICHILSFLPTTRHAVRTSVLSRRWKFLWTGVPSLHFDYDGFLCQVTKSPERRKSFEQFVNKVLLLSTAQSMHKFTLSYTDKPIDSFYFQAWISTAVIRNVRVLDVHCAVDLMDLPTCLFTCGTLEILELSGPMEIDAPNAVCLPRLTRLKLVKVRFPWEDEREEVRFFDIDEPLLRLISGCPILEFLHIDVGCDGHVLTISSPSLKRLYLRAADISGGGGYHKIKINTPALECLDFGNRIWEESYVTVQSMTSLVTANIDFQVDDPVFDPLPQSDFCDQVVEIVRALHSVKFLTLSQVTMMALSYATALLSATRFERLTKLVVGAVSCKWACLQDLLEGAVNLEVLEFTKYRHDGSYQELCWRNPDQVPGCLITSLKQVMFRKLEGSDDELAMIGYILEHGIVLNQMKLDSASSHDGVKIRLIRKVLWFPRRSPTCQIAFDSGASVSFNHYPFSASYNPMGERNMS